VQLPVTKCAGLLQGCNTLSQNVPVCRKGATVQHKMWRFIAVAQQPDTKCGGLQHGCNSSAQNVATSCTKTMNYHGLFSENFTKNISIIKSKQEVL
jgi:hypothetical protein